MNALKTMFHFLYMAIRIVILYAQNQIFDSLQRQHLYIRKTLCFAKHSVQLLLAAENSEIDCVRNFEKKNDFVTF
jgi:hypothetical protein